MEELIFWDKITDIFGIKHILIDDMERNIREWNEMGGTGIVNVDAAHTMEQLKQLGIL